MSTSNNINTELMEPHKSRLPVWSRPALFRRGSDVRMLKRDRLLMGHSREGGGADAEAKSRARASAAEMQARLEKHVAFLKQQHRETLQHLHAEIERLKAENRDLNFKLIMCRCGASGGNGGKAQHSPSRKHKVLQSSFSGEDTELGTPNEELRVIFLEDEVHELKNALSSEKSKNIRLMKVIEKKVLEQRRSDQSNGENLEYHERLKHPLMKFQHQATRGGREGKGGGRERTLSIAEYETVIKHLQQKTVQQSHELMRIKADLRDVLYSHKWTPDAYLIARAYVSGEGREEEEEEEEEEKEIEERTSEILPKIPQQGVNKHMMERAYQQVREGVVLPALKPKVPAMAAERQRRSHAMRPRGKAGARERTALQ